MKTARYLFIASLLALSGALMAAPHVSLIPNTIQTTTFRNATSFAEAAVDFPRETILDTGLWIFPALFLIASISAFFLEHRLKTVTK